MERRPLGLYRCLGAGTSTDAVPVSQQSAKRGQIDFGKVGPAQNGEQVSVGQTERLTPQECAILEMPAHEGQALLQFLQAGGIGTGENPHESFVNLAADEYQPLYGPEVIQ